MSGVQLEERVADGFWGWVEYTVCLRTRRRALLHVRTLAEMIHDAVATGYGYEGERPALTGPRCARVHGFSLHANTEIPAHRRDQLERLIRYTGRGAVALERLAEDAHGDLVYTFSRSWSDGTTGITLSPLEFLEKLAALVPLPRVHLVRYAGCLRWRWPAARFASAGRCGSLPPSRRAR